MCTIKFLTLYVLKISLKKKKYIAPEFLYKDFLIKYVTCMCALYTICKKKKNSLIKMEFYVLGSSQF